MRQGVAGRSSFPPKIGPALSATARCFHMGRPDVQDPPDGRRRPGARLRALRPSRLGPERPRWPHGATASADAPQIHPWGFDLGGRDLAVKPGDDFNEYANGTYLKNTQIPSDKARFGPFDVL